VRAIGSNDPEIEHALVFELTTSVGVRDQQIGLRLAAGFPAMDDDTTGAAAPGVQ
jgi:hypothetical protein